MCIPLCLKNDIFLVPIEKMLSTNVILPKKPNLERQFLSSLHLDSPCLPWLANVKAVQSKEGEKEDNQVSGDRLEQELKCN